MVDNVRKHSRFLGDYFILVVDNDALKVFSSCCQLFELVSISRIYHIEKLEKVRKRYKKTDVIYFITPTKKSIDMVLADFPDEIQYKYGAVHFCFTSHVSDDLMKPVAQNKSLAPRVASFNEINLDFFMFNDNVFHLNMKNSLPIFKVMDDDPKFLEGELFAKMSKVITHKLLTVCTVYDEFPYIQYQGSSKLSKAIAN